MKRRKFIGQASIGLGGLLPVVKKLEGLEISQVKTSGKHLEIIFTHYSVDGKKLFSKKFIAGYKIPKYP